jgi:hypothetical protein
MDRIYIGTFLQSLVAVFFVGFLMSCSFSQSSVTTNWQIVPSPHLPSQQNHLWSVSASAANDGWAVGESFDGSHRKTLIEHWSGKQWSVVVSPNPGSDPTLQGVAAISPGIVWAVGGTSLGHGMTTVLVEQWNGSQWNVVQAPNPGSGGSFLSKVVAIAANNVWAVGTTVDAGVDKPLIEHWDRGEWHVVSNYNPTSIPTLLTGITAISANDIWAVGYAMPSPSSHRAFIEYWNGTIWKIIDTSDLKTVDSQLLSVSAVSANDVWAMGSLENGPTAKPLIEKWDGLRWSASLIPNGLENGFSAIVAISANDVWAAGSTNEANGQPVILVHWDGEQWSSVQAANASLHCQNELSDLTVIPQKTIIWAVGDYVASSCRNKSQLLVQPLFESYTLKRA